MIYATHTFPLCNLSTAAEMSLVMARASDSHYRSTRRFWLPTARFHFCLQSRESDMDDANPSVCFRWSMGSMLFLASWAVLMGPVQYAQHLISGPRLPFTAAYFGSITLTLIFAIKVSLHFLCVLIARNHQVMTGSGLLFIATSETCLLTNTSHDSCKAPS